MCYIYATGYCSTVKKSKIVKFRDKSIQLETFILSEVNQAQKERCHSFFSLALRLEIIAFRIPVEVWKLRRCHVW